MQLGPTGSGRPDRFRTGRVPAAPSSLKQSGKRTWKQMWENGRAWLGPSDEIVVRLACEQVDELVSLRRSAAQLKRPELRLKYLRAIQESEKALLQTVSALAGDRRCRVPDNNYRLERKLVCRKLSKQLEGGRQWTTLHLRTCGRNCIETAACRW